MAKAKISAQDKKVERETAAQITIERESKFYEQRRTMEQVRSEALASAIEGLSPDDPEVQWRYRILVNKVPQHGIVTPADCAVKDVPRENGHCISCGERTREENFPWRCIPCIKAMKLVYQTHQQAQIQASMTVVVDEDFELDDE